MVDFPRIAIVGIACRYPDAATPDELWDNVLAQRRAFRRLPDTRLPAADYCSTDTGAPDLTYSAMGAVLDGYQFDRVRYRVSAETFRSVDLTHWLALDVAHDALADAGFAGAAGLPHATAGVLVGNTLTGEFSRAAALRVRWPYVRRVVDAMLAGSGESIDRREARLKEIEARYKAPFPPVDGETLAGSLSNTIAGRICNYFNLKGGGYTVDGACASSLLAVVNACSALTCGDLDVAIAGGVDLSLDPFELVGFAKAGALAKDAMRVYDARPTGFWPGEGCGFVVLMREDDAVAAGRRVRGLVRGWGVASDGNGGMTRPQAEGQMLALKRAYRRAGVSPGSIPYFEGHGTGTAAGDATELSALVAIRTTGGTEPMPAVIGSVKANIGHTKAAAGVAGLIKAVCALQAQVLPPTTACEQPHPTLAQAGAMLSATPEARDWPSDAPLRAGVSAMGFGGINAHIVVEAPASTVRRTGGSVTAHCSAVQDAELIAVAADDLRDLKQRLAALKEAVPVLSMAELTDLAVHLQRTCGPGHARAAMVASTPDELAANLSRAIGAAEQGTRWISPDGAVAVSAHTVTPRIAFLFSGQGVQVRTDGGKWRSRFDAAAQLYRDAALPSGFAPESTAIVQPAIMTATLAAIAVCEGLGLHACVGIGHSLGEIAALTWAGGFSPATAIKLAAARGRLMEPIAGAMAALQTTYEVASALLDGTTAVVAAINSPTQVVVAGPEGEIEGVIQRAKARHIAATRVAVAHPFHSPLMQPVAAPLAEVLGRAATGTLRRSVISTVSGLEVTRASDIRELLIRQLTEPVLFADAVSAAGPIDLFVELGPGRTLAALVAGMSPVPAVAIDAGGQSLIGLLRALGAAFALGAPIDLARLAEGRYAKPFDLSRSRAFLVNPCELAARASDRSAPQAGDECADHGVEAERIHVQRERGGLAVADTSANAICEHLRGVVARRTDLPLTAVTASSRFLSDLHLNSLTVSEVLREAVTAFGLQTLTAPTDYADATLADAADALHALGATAPSDVNDGLAPSGLGNWVRAFVTREHERAVAPSATTQRTGRWRVAAPSGHPLAERLTRVFQDTTGGPGIVVCMDSGLDADIGALLEAARETLRAPAPQRLIVVQQDAGISGFARSVFLEGRGVDVAVVTIDVGRPDAVDLIHQEALAVEGFVDARYGDDGRRRVPCVEVVPVPPVHTTPLRDDDVLLVTGGAKGIGAECAAALARATQATLVLLGRSAPDEPALVKNLERLKLMAPRVSYLQADVTDAASVRSAIQRITAECGRVTAILHAAGVNEPALVAALDPHAIGATSQVKLDGARHLLAAVEPSALRMFITFGSVIARTGLPGEAHYALANERLRMFTEDVARRLPHCRALNIEWSVWAAAGMGERLGRIDALAAYGVDAIAIADGVDMLFRLMSLDSVGTSVVVASRLGHRPILEFAAEPLPFLRFLESPRVHCPGVELVADATVGRMTDPYLDDHRIDGQRLFPGVMALEAMAQCAMALVGTGRVPAFENVEFQRPLVVEEGASETVRVIGLQEWDGSVRVALRASSTRFACDHFAAVCRWPSAAPGLGASNGNASITTSPSEAPSPPTGLYGSLFFQSGRFSRVQRYRELFSTRCAADIAGGADAWFGTYLPSTLVLGDSGARDAALHSVQATIPQQRLLPVSVASIRVLAPLSGPCHVRARQRAEHGRDYFWDLDIFDAAGTLVEVWTDARLRALGTLAVGTETLALLGPYLERRLPALGHAGAPRVLCVEAARRRPNGDDAIHLLLGDGVALRRRSDGKPEVSDGAVSVSHGRGLTLAVAATVPIGCDVETIEPRSSELWCDLLGRERADVGEWIARETAESGAAARTRVWTAIESLKKAGAPPNLPLTVGRQPADGWVTLKAGRYRVSTWVPAGPANGIALAVATEDVDAQL